MLQVEPPTAELRQPGGGGGMGAVQRALRPPPAAALQPPAPLLPSQLPAPAPAAASLVSRHILGIFISEDTSASASAGGAPAAGSPVGAAAQSGPRRQEEGEDIIYYLAFKTSGFRNRERECVLGRVYYLLMEF